MVSTGVFVVSIGLGGVGRLAGTGYVLAGHILADHIFTDRVFAIAGNRRRWRDPPDFVDRRSRKSRQDRLDQRVTPRLLVERRFRSLVCARKGGDPASCDTATSQ